MIWGDPWPLFSMHCGMVGAVAVFSPPNYSYHLRPQSLWITYRLYIAVGLLTSLTFLWKGSPCWLPHSCCTPSVSSLLAPCFHMTPSPPTLSHSSACNPPPSLFPSWFAHGSWYITPLPVSSMAISLCTLLVIYSASPRFWTGIFSSLTQWLPRAAWGNHSVNTFIVSGLSWNPEAAVHSLALCGWPVSCWNLSTSLKPSSYPAPPLLPSGDDFPSVLVC